MVPARKTWPSPKSSKVYLWALGGHGTPREVQVDVGDLLAPCSPGKVSKGMLNPSFTYFVPQIGHTASGMSAPQPTPPDISRWCRLAQTGSWTSPVAQTGFLPQTDHCAVPLPDLLPVPGDGFAVPVRPDHEAVVGQGMDVQVVIPGGDAAQLLPVFSPDDGLVRAPPASQAEPKMRPSRLALISLLGMMGNRLKYSRWDREMSL